MPPDPPPEPWLSFLRELDAVATDIVRLDCSGGFVMTQLYDFVRGTSDIDALAIAPNEQAGRLLAVGCQGSKLHQKFGVYLEQVGIATYPDSYEDRLIEMYPGLFKNLRLLALEAHDLALTKLERNSQRDRDDVKHLARTGRVTVQTLTERYHAEFRPYLANPAREDLTLKLWTEMIEEETGTAKKLERQSPPEEPDDPHEPS